MNNPSARTKDVVVQGLENETLIYDLKANKAFCLNETSALIWELCDGSRSINEISDRMGTKQKAYISEDFVNLAIDQLSKNGLLEDYRTDYLRGLSRREAIQKVGFATVVALPTVSSLVAPEAASAQSCMAVGTTCSSGADCCSNNCNTLGTGNFGGGVGVGSQSCCVGSGAGAPGALFCGPFVITPGVAPEYCCSGTWVPTVAPACPGVSFKRTCL